MMSGESESQGMKNPLKHWERQRKRFKALQDRIEDVEKLLESSPLNYSPKAALPQIYERLGLSLILDQSSLVDKTVINSGAWECAQLEFLFSTASSMMDIKRAVFLDVGAYWGLYSLKAVQSGFGRVVAFESDPYNFSQLQAQLFLNRFADRIEAHNLPISDSDKRLILWKSEDHPEGNRAGVGVKGFPRQRSFEADARSLDSVLGLSGMDVVIKVDVEGYEASVLKGMTNLVAANRILLQVEIFEDQEKSVLPICEELGLKKVNQIHVDHYFTASR